MFNLFSWVINRPFTKGLSVILVALALVSCGDTDGAPEDVVGVAANGAATQGTVFLIDSEGTEITKPINIDGYFRFDARGMVAPFMLKTVDENGVDPDLFSFVEEPNILVNVTPLTNFTMSIANGGADLGLLYDNWVSSFGTIDALAVKDIQAAININLNTQYFALGLDPLTYDFFATLFSTNGTNIDGLLDAMTIDLLAGTINIAGIASTIIFDPNIDITGSDIGGEAVEEIGAYSLGMDILVDDVAYDSLLLAINLPVAYVPVPSGSTQIVEDMFVTFYNSVGTIVINSVVTTIEVDTSVPPIETTVAVLDATITTTDDVALHYVITYNYEENL